MDPCPQSSAPLCLSLSYLPLPLSLEKIPARKAPGREECKTTMLDGILLSSMYCPLCLFISIYGCRTDEFSDLVINSTPCPNRSGCTAWIEMSVWRKTSQQETQDNITGTSRVGTSSLKKGDGGESHEGRSFLLARVDGFKNRSEASQRTWKTDSTGLMRTFQRKPANS